LAVNSSTAGVAVRPIRVAARWILAGLAGVFVLAALVGQVFAGSPSRLVVQAPGQEIGTADELKAELERGLRVEASDFDPMRVFRPRR